MCFSHLCWYKPKVARRYRKVCATVEKALIICVWLTYSSGALETMLDMALVSIAKGECLANGFDVIGQIASLFNKDQQELWDCYVSSRGFTALHKILLRVDNHQTLDEFLTQLWQDGTISHMINTPDKHYRTALTWAVEFGWSDAVETLLKYGAKPDLPI